MRIAVTYDYDTKEVGQHFGKTEHFLLVDVNGDQRSEMIVTNGGYSHHELVSYLKDLEVDVLLAGGMGNHAYQFLMDVNIETHAGLIGDAHEAVEQFLNGELKEDVYSPHECDCHHHDA